MAVETVPLTNGATPQKSSWQKIVARYQSSDIRVSVWQMFNSIAPFFILWYLAYRALEVSYVLTLAFCVVAALFGMRIFIIFHDAGHGSFFKNRRWNEITGVLTGIITYTPYYAWRHAHAVHHATASDLDHRGTGDIWTLTYQEYQKLSRINKIAYRLYRNPLVIFVFGPVLEFVVLQRLPSFNHSKKGREVNSITYTNIALLLIFLGMSATIGMREFILVQLPIIWMAASLGVWMFYVQHQYEDMYWEHHEDWDFERAALEGSSFYKLPRVLQWFTGNIGFHHIHHLSPRIPNYKLEAAHTENEIFQVEPMTLRSSLKSLRIRLWDEDRSKMIGFHKDAPNEDPAMYTADYLTHTESAAD